MSKVYVTGHRNPDMDSVCSAYSYSVLKNLVDEDNDYVPVVLGPVNATAKELFRKLGLDLPEVLKDVKAKACDVVRTPDYTLRGEDPVYDLVSLYNTKHPSVVPIMDDGVYEGLVSVDDINRFFLRENHSSRPLYSIRVDNIPRVIGGRFLKRGNEDSLETVIVVGAMEYDVFQSRVEACPSKPILVVGNRKRHIEYAIAEQLPGIILTGIGDAGIPDIDFSSFAGFVYISDEDTAETLRLMRLATPIRKVIPMKEGPIVQLDTPYDEVKNTLVNSEYRGISVFDKDRWAGFVTRRCFLNRPMAKVIMMDHNEAEQSVVGIEEADILEIIDHHRLAAPKMKNPIYICSEPLGSTCTIVYEQYKKWGIEIPRNVAYVMLSGVIADTVMLKSPTTTAYDRHVARRLAAIAGVSDLAEFSRNLFSSSSTLSSLDPAKVIEGDFKRYEEFGVKFGIGQVEVPNLVEIHAMTDIYIDALEKTMAALGLDWAMLLVTDVFSEKSVLITTGFEKEYRFVYEKLRDKVYSLPGILSRKKQLLPEVLRVLED